MNTIRARLADPLPGLALPDGNVPDDIQWMPPGRHTITALKEGKPFTLTVEVDEALAGRVAGALQARRGAAAAGREDLPFFDFNHEDQEASGHPVDIYWAGEDPVAGGIRAKVQWTEAGKAALAGRMFRRFSPEFGLTKDGQITAAGVNMGGLVNRAAFKSIAPIWSRSGHDGTAGPEPQPQHTMLKTTEEQLAELSSVTSGLAKNLEALTKQVETLAAKSGAPDAKVLVLETQVSALTAAAQVQAKDAAKAKVQAAIQAGKIPPQDKDLIEKWESLIVVDARNADLLDKLPANPALQRVVPNATAAVGGGAAGEHEFVVKAKAAATERKLTLVEAQSAIAREHPELYAAYRKSLQLGPND